MSVVDKEELRSLNNLISSLQVDLSDIKSNLLRLKRKRDSNENLIRRVMKEIEQKKMYLKQLQDEKKKFDNEEFELLAEEKLLKKKLNELIAKKSRLSVN